MMKKRLFVSHDGTIFVADMSSDEYLEKAKEEDKKNVIVIDDAAMMEEVAPCHHSP